MKYKVAFDFRFLVLLSFLLLCCEKENEKYSSSSNEPGSDRSIARPSALPLSTIPPRVGPIQISQWLSRHWQRPIPPQGKAPDHWPSLEKDLSPQACGECHTQRYNDWMKSRHHKSMGPGILGQLIDMEVEAPHFSETCQACHAPLAEQAPYVGPGKPNPIFDRALRDEGLVCAACHVRAHQRFGPNKGKKITDKTPHGGFITKKEFSDPAFCAVCHDFLPNGNTLNGKLIQETGEEWRRTSFAAEGKTCQSCHMPEGRHLWKGIHDSAMTASAVEVRAEMDSVSAGQRLRARLRLENVGAGHRLPTYMTPQITLVFEQLDDGGKPIPGTLREAAIARRVTVDMREEIYDTRLMPGESFDLPYDLLKHDRAVWLQARVEVWPDEWYRMFFEHMLSNPKLLPKGGEEHIKRAHREAEGSRYVLWEREWGI